MKYRSMLGLWVSGMLVACSSDPPGFVPDDAGDETAIDVTQDDLVTPPPFDIQPLEGGACAGSMARCEGACVDTQIAVAHCGGCGRDCRALPGVSRDAVRCVRGVCELTAGCVAGRAHCTLDPADGCEADVTTAARCGACSVRCEGATPMCTMRAQDGGGPRHECSSDCAGVTPTRCGGVCADISSSTTNCGACGAVCPTRLNARAECARGVCGVACNTGYADCDGLVTNGCEANLNTSVTHCGMCGMRCVAPTGMTASCVAGLCVNACATGMADCDANPANGCETNTRSDLANCGRCTNMCISGPGSTATCLSGTCRLTCVTGFGDCDGMPATGCETDVRASAVHCGACARVCASPPNGTAVCADSVCRITCAAGFYASGVTCQPIPAPLLISPLSTARVTSLRPTLTWRNTSPANGARLELCRDRACAAVSRSVEVTGTSTTLAEDLAPGVWYWRAVGRQDRAAGLLPSTTWQFTVGPRGAAVDASWGGALDVNGDGLGDLAIGGSESPQVFVHHASAAGLSRTATATLAVPSGTTGMGFGRALSAADVNGDGFSDLVVVAPVGTARGFVYHGGSGGLGAAVSTTINSSLAGFGAALSPVGDVNNDGYADVAFGVSTMGRVLIHFGGRTGLAIFASLTFSGPTGSLFGQSLAGLGDATGDGFDDMLVGGPGANAAYFFSGTATSLATAASAVFPGPAGATDYGAAVASAGDLNGDGLTDLAIAAPSAARVDVFHGRVGGPSAAPTVTLTGAMGSGFGASLVGGFDANRDGFSDLAVGASTTREVRIYLGGASGLSTTPAVTLTAPMDAANFSFAMAPLADSDSDGFDDLAVGAHGAATVFLYRGAASAISPTPAFAINGPPSVGFGFGLAGAWR